MFDATPIENMFLLEYLPTAPEGFLRVYLYARMLCLHPELGGELTDMARALRMDENELLNAFLYWEHQGLAEKTSDRPPTYALKPLRTEGECKGEIDREYYHYREYNSSLQAMFGSEALLEPRQYKLANDWLNVLGLTQDAAIRILFYEKSLPGGKKPASVFQRADKRAIDYAERGIRTLAQVEQAIAHDDRLYAIASAVMKKLGLNRKATPVEMEIVHRWVDEWKLSKEFVLEACDMTSKSRNPSIAYLDEILKSRRQGENKFFEGTKAVLRELGITNAAPSPEQQRSYGAWLEKGFEPETLLQAAIQCNRRNKCSFKDFEWMLGRWEEQKIFTRNQAEEYVAHMQELEGAVRALLERAGRDKQPSMDDLTRYEALKQRYASELIEFAADCAKNARMPLRYIQKLLEEWSAAGINTLEAAKARNASEGAKANAKDGAKARSNPAVSDYMQREYSAQDFNESFFYDPTKDYSEEDVQP